MPATDKPEIFAVVWIDTLLGPLSLHKPDAAAALTAAASIREKGGSKVQHVRAVHIPAGLDELRDL